MSDMRMERESKERQRESLHSMSPWRPPAGSGLTINDQYEWSSRLCWTQTNMRVLGGEVKRNELIPPGLQACFLTVAAPGRLLLCSFTRKFTSNQAASFQDCRKVRGTGHTGDPLQSPFPSSWQTDGKNDSRSPSAWTPASRNQPESIQRRQKMLSAFQ